MFYLDAVVLGTIIDTAAYICQRSYREHFMLQFGLRSAASLVLGDFVIASVHPIPITPNRAPIHITSEKASRKDDVAPAPLCVKYRSNKSNNDPPTVIPAIIPMYRNVAKVPEAKPCLGLGADPKMAELFGAANIPVPSPDRTSPIISAQCASATDPILTMIPNKMRPNVLKSMPDVVKKRGPIRSDNVPAIGAQTVMIKGVMVKYLPVAEAEY